MAVLAQGLVLFPWLTSLLSLYQGKQHSFLFKDETSLLLYLNENSHSKMNILLVLLTSGCNTSLQLSVI